ncbi:TIGR04168 family protein [Leptolyngbya ohadii]|uniref:TIGR04168 family protein n=1 Tax=Leptolyngbya ohadii TaxID=1962290 RepID=UPI000B5A030D|nr:TIGR04168 family protein [Leptolyngbya ohadii]
MVNAHTPLPAADSTAPMNKALTIAVVGDVHDLWEPADEQALKHLGVDLVLLVGDFGNESVEVVRSIAEMDIPKAAIFGNHDAWYTATHWGKKMRTHKEDRVQIQIDLLGEAHVGYGKLDFPEFNLTVVGGRPFSWGGSDWSAHGQFYKERYGVQSFEESTAKIVQAVKDGAHDTVIFIGHCGPKGLGDQPEDPCGKDWKPLGGDHGDPDLTAAIEETLLLGKSVPLVTFGHMHHGLRHTKDRLRKMIDTSPHGTVYLNAASVPRIVQDDTGRRRNFSLVKLEAGTVTQVSLVWVDEEDAIVSEQGLYQAESAPLQIL